MKINTLAGTRGEVGLGAGGSLRIDAVSGLVLRFHVVDANPKAMRVRFEEDADAADKLAHLLRRLRPAA